MFEQLNNTFNIFDVASTEKSDITDMVKGTNYSKVILLEILTPGLYSIHVKIFDFKTQKYLYNGKIWSDRNLESKAMNDLSIGLDKVLRTVL